MPDISTINDIRSLINDSLSKDQHRFRRQLKKLQSSQNLQQKNDLLNQVKQSCEAVDQRRLSCPSIDFPTLSISEKRDQIAELIKKHQVIILCGETGSGKTTQLPKICLALGRGLKGQIGHTQPRRLAAVSVAQRIADELKVEVGQAVGYKIRFQGKEKDQTLIKLMTDGILLAEIKSDPFLSRYDTLILDEAHERSLNIDFLLGYMKWLLPKRPDLKLIVTSATIDPERFSKHFNNAPIINVSGRTYPVEMRYRPIEAGLETNEQSRTEAIVAAVDELHREKLGDILVFLSGEREIREATQALRKQHLENYDILPLYSRLSAKEQSNIFKAHKKSRIVLATNVAETSLTVPGIRCVIDTGLARISRFSQRSKIQQLPIEPISQASANQRSGRCGREAPGVCIRLFSEADFNQRAEFTEPEILRTNLASVILQMKSLRLAEISHFPFIEPPADKMIRSGIRSLHELGALDKNEKLTQIGKRLIHFPLDPQFGRMLLAAEPLCCLDEVLTIVSALSIQDPRERPSDKAKYADEKHKAYQNETSDFLSFINLWREIQKQKKALSNHQFRKYCHENFLAYMRVKDWEDIRRQLLDLVSKNASLTINSTEANDDAIHQALLTGLVTRIGFKHDKAEYLGARNLKFYLHPSSALFKKQPKWVMAAEQVETTRVYARTMASIKPEWIEKAAAHLIKRHYYEPHWSKKSAQGMFYEQQLLFGLTVSKGRAVPMARTEPTQAREMFIRRGLVDREMVCHAAFFRKNEKLLEGIEYEQQKGRRVDLLVDEQALFEFYDDKLPDNITSLALLNKWIKNDKNQTSLELTTEDVSSKEESTVDAQKFPDVRLINGVPITLNYRFEPGHQDDGVTAEIPLAQLNQLTEEGFEWLVPGLYAEKLQALIKGLPKNLRKQFVPVPNYVEACIDGMEYSSGRLLEKLAGFLNKLTGSNLRASDFELEKLPPHLSMSFCILRDKSSVLAVSKDFNALKRQYAEKAGAQFQTALSDALSSTGSKKWQFDEIPEQQTIQHQGQELKGFPALVDEKTSVGLRLMDSAEEAQKTHKDGLIRLFRLKFAKELKKLSRQSAITTSQAFSYQHLNPHPHCQRSVGEDIFDDLVHQLIASYFADQDIRTEKEFDQAAQKNDVSLYAKGYELSETISSLLAQHQRVMEALNKWRNEKALYADISQQLSCLCFEGFIRHVPADQLEFYTRYLKAILIRLEKAAGQLEKDAVKAKQAQFFEKKFWQFIASTDTAPEDDSFRWLLEEFRISLFAQQIKTRQPISEKRLEKAWAARFN